MTSPGAYSAGTAYLDVIPSFKGVQEAIGREVRKMEHAIGKGAGDSVAKGMESGAKEGVKAVDKALGTTKASAAKAGDEAAKAYAGRFQTAMRAAVVSANRELKALKLDDEDLKRQIKTLQQNLQGLSKVKIGKDMQAGPALITLGKVEDKIREIRDAAEDAGLRMNSGAAVKDLEAFRKEFEDKADFVIEPEIKADKEVGLFAANLRKRIQAALSNFPPVEFDANIAGAELQLAKLRQRLQDIGNAEIGASFSGTQAIAQAEAVRRALAGLATDETVDLKVRGDAAGAAAELMAIHKIMDLINKTTVEIPVEVEERELGLFASTLKKRIENSLKSIDVPTGDWSQGDVDIQPMRDRLGELRDIVIGGDFDGSEIMAEIETIRKAMATLANNKDIDVRVRSNAAQVAKELLEVRGLMELVDKTEIDIKVDVDPKKVDTFANRLHRLRDSLAGSGADGQDGANAFRAFNAVILGVAAGVAALSPLLMAGAGAMVLFGAAALGAAGGLGVMLFGFGGITSAVQALGKAQDNAGKDAEAYAKKVRSASQGVADAQQGLANAERRAARSARDSARAVTDARENAARATEDAAERVADAQSSAAKSAEDAAERVVDAQRAEVENNQAAAEAVVEARRRAGEAAESAARQVADAVERQQDAEENLVDAQQDVVRAQEDVTRARERAAERLEDLRLQIEGGALSERQAVLDLAAAQNEYMAALDDPGATAREREELLIRYQREELALRRIREENGDLAEEQAEFNRRGIEGSDEVVSAQERVRDAQGRVADAMEGVRDASRGVSDAMENQRRTAADGQRAIAEALESQRRTAAEGREAVTDALEAQAEAAASGQEAIADALQAQRDAAADGTRAVADALQNQRDAAVDSQEAIAAAQRNLSEAQIRYQEALNETSTSAENLATEMGKLGPAGQAFALFIHSLRDDFREMRDIVQTGMLPGVQDAISTILTKNGPLIREFLGSMGRAVGDVFRQFGDLMTSPQWQAIWAVFADTAPTFFKQFAEIGMNVLTALGILFVGTAPSAERFGDALVRISENMVTWMESFVKSDAFQAAMAWLFEKGPVIWDTILSVGRAIGNLLIALEPLGMVVLDVIDGIADFIADMDPQVLGGLATAALGLAVAFQLAAGAVSLVLGFFAILSTGLSLWVFVIGAVITGLVVLYTQSETFRDIVNGVFRAIGDVVEWWWDSVLKPVLGAAVGGLQALWEGAQWAWENVGKPVFEAVAAVATWLWENILAPIFGLFRMVWDTLWGFVSGVFYNIGKPVFDVLVDVVKNLWDIVGPIFKLFGLVFSALFREIVAPAWKFIGKPIFDAIVGEISWLWKNIAKPLFRALGTAWEALWAGVSLIWYSIGKPIFDLVEAIVKTLVEVFQGNFGDIGEIWRDFWNSLKVAAAKPINFVIHFVLNKGLFAAFNKIIDTLKLDKDWKIRGVSQIGPAAARYAAGGRVTGWSPNDVADNIPAMLTAGEWVQPVDTVRYYGADFMEAVRKKKIPRDSLRYLATGGEVAGYATGGQIFAATQRMFPRAKLNSSYRPGDPGYHGRNMAADLGEAGFAGGAGRKYIADMKRWWVDNYGGSAAEIIYDGLFNDRPDILDGRRHQYSLATRLQHFNHLHVAYPGSLGAVGGPPRGGTSVLDVLVGLGNPALAAANNAGLVDVDSVFSKLTNSIKRIGEIDGMLDNGPANAIKAMPRKAVDWAWGKIKGSVGDFFSNAWDAVTGVPDSNHQPFGLQGGPVVDQVKGVAALYGWDRGAQWAALNRLIMKESSWNPTAQNPTSTAYGLFQFLNSTWAGTGIDKTSDPRMQAQAGLKYIRDRYGSPSEALGFHLRNNWYSEGGEVTPAISSGGNADAPTLYDSGGWVPPGIHTVLNASRRPEPILTSQQWDELTASRAGGTGDAPLIGAAHFHEVVTDPDSIIGSLNHWTNVARRGGRYDTVGAPS